MAAAALGGGALTLAHPSATRQFTWPWVGLLALVWLVPFGSGLAAGVQRPSWQRPNTLLTVGLLLLAGTTVASAFASPFAPLSLLRIWPTLTGVVVFFWLHDWLAQPADSGRDRAQQLTRGIAGFGGIVTMVSIVSWRWRSVGGAELVRNDVPFGHSTYTAGIMVLLLPWLLQATINSRGVRRLGWALIAVAGFAVLLSTSSRGGVMAVGIVGVIGSGCILVHAPWSGRAKTLAVGVIIGILLLAIFANPRLRELVRHGGWGESARESNAQRSAMIEAGRLMGESRPWTGWGPGTVPMAYPKFRGRLSGGVDNVLQLHNTPAQLWATLGLGGVLALCLLAAAAMRRSWQIGKQPRPEPAALTAAASLLGYGLFSLTDHQLDLPAMNALLVLNLALFFQHEPGTKISAVGNSQRQLALLATGLVLVVPVALNIRDLAARFSDERALSLYETGKPAEGLIQLETAARRAPDDPYYRQQIAGRLLEERGRSPEPARQHRLANEAAAQLEQSLSTGCFEEFAQLNLGWLALENAEPLRAARHFLSAAREAPHRGGIYFGLGLALRDAGDETGAVHAFALEWLNDPGASTAPVWEWPDFAPLRPKIEREAVALLTELAPNHPEAGYVRELWRWWADGTPPAATGFNQETAAFIETLAALARHQAPPAAAGQYSWGKLFEQWKLPPDRADFGVLAGHDPGFAALLARRTALHPPPDWHGFLTAGLENETGLLISSRAARTGYGVLTLHPNGPILTDLYVRQQNRLVSTFASTLFPAKGWLPARELLNRLPALPSVKP